MVTPRQRGLCLQQVGKPQERIVVPQCVGKDSVLRVKHRAALHQFIHLELKLLKDALEVRDRI